MTCAIEPAALAERDAAAFLAVSPRLFRQLVTRGDVRPIRIPGVRRVVFDVAELRALLVTWKTGGDRRLHSETEDRAR